MSCPIYRAPTLPLSKGAIPLVEVDPPSVEPNTIHSDAVHQTPTPYHSVDTSDFAAKRLAEYVVKMNEQRETTGTQGFKNSLKQKSEELLNNLYQETRLIEKEVLIGEVEVFKLNEEAFFKNINDLEILDIKLRQEEELAQLKLRQTQIVKDYEARKAGKLTAIKQQRELKMLYLETQFRAELAQRANQDKQKLSSHRQKVAKIIHQMEERHTKQIVQFNAAEERNFQNKKLLLQLQSASLSEEERGEAEKKFQARLTHQKVIHKKRLEHMQDQQRLELRQFKEKADKEGLIMEELAYLKSCHYQEEQDLLCNQKTFYYQAKDKIIAAKKMLKLADYKYQHNMDISKVKSQQKNRIREALKEHKDLLLHRRNYWEYVLGRESAMSDMLTTEDDLGTSADQSRTRSNQSQSHSSSQSKAHSRKNSDSNLRNGKKAAKESDSATTTDEVEKSAIEMETLIKLQNQLNELKKKHNDEFYKLKSENGTAYEVLKEKLESELAQMDMNHDVERKRATQDAENEIAELVQNQEKEIELENHIRAAETKALIERKVLINMLDTFTDGVISIDNCGFIQRFNNAAERMFGYTAAEIFENKLNIKSLMPKEFASRHDTFIGKVTKTYGLKKDGTKFPIHLSVSEVVESGFHQFTGIVRDLTAEVESENYKQSTETQMMWQIDRSGKVISLNQRFKSYVGISTKEQEETASVFSEDVVHPNEYQLGLDAFAQANRDLKPFEIKRRLKSSAGGYRWFLTKGIPVFDTTGKFKQWYGACTDIDDAVVLETELATLQEKLPIFIWKSDPNGELYFSNLNFKNYSGIDFSITKTLLYSEKLCYEKDYAMVQEAFERAKSKKIGIDFKFRLKSKDGKCRWFNCSGSPITDPNGKLISFYGMCKDINEAEQIAQEMVLLPESLPQMIWKIDPQGNVLYCNSRFTKYIGASPGAMLNVFDKAVVHPEDYNASYNAFALGNREKKTFIVKRRLKCGNGTYSPFVTKGTPILNDMNEIVGWYGTCTPEE
ncbi:hypothetical protein HDV06_001146 [Boothiomyces sp. JEL0866]|nr:hypothetical protein HDV06_001146 [Boothiomyces sp. JEL0866]